MCAENEQASCSNQGGEWINGSCAAQCDSGQRNSAGECVFVHQNVSLFLYNNTQRPALMRVMRLRDDVRLDCATVQATPARLLKRQLFEAAGSWTIGPREVRPLAETDHSTEHCRAIILTDDIMPAQLITFDPAVAVAGVWDEPTLTNLPAPGIVLIDGPDGPFVEAYGSGPTITRLTSTPRAEEFGESCQPVPDRDRLEWSPSVVASHQATLDSVESGADGCLALDFTRVAVDSSERWYVCMPDEAFPFSPGDVLELSSEVETGGRSLRFRRITNPEGADSEEDSDPNAETELVLLREYSEAVTAAAGVQLTLSATETCAAVPDQECGTVHQEATASLTLSTAEGVVEVESAEMGADEWIEYEGTDGRVVSVHLARVALRPVVAPSC